MRSRVGELRAERGVTRRELSAATGLTEKVLYRYEKGFLEHAELGCIARVARALGVGVDDLFAEDPGDRGREG